MSDPVTKTIIVGGSPAEIYAVWSNFAMFPQFMKNITSVTMSGADKSHWVMEGPLNYKLEWDAETTTLEPGRRIAWRSIDSEDTNLKTSGQVTFTELANNQTQVTVTLHFVPPAGIVGEVAASLFGNPEGRLEEDLQNFKRFVENTQRRVVSQAEATRMSKQ